MIFNKFSNKTRYEELMKDFGRWGRTEMRAYCLKCRAKRDLEGAKSVTMKNGKPAIQCMCANCGTIMYRMGQS